MTVPSEGAFGSSIDNAVSYTIGQQAMHGRIDPGLATTSSFLAELRVITLQSGPGGQDSQQTIGQVTLDSSLSPTATLGRSDLLTRDSVTNWHVVTRDRQGGKSESSASHVDGHVSLHGLDRAQAMRFVTALRSFRRTLKPSDRQPGAAAERLELRDVLNATAGLLTRVEADETLDGITFNLGSGKLGSGKPDPGSSGTLGRMRLQLKGDAADQRLNAGMDITMDEISVASLSAAAASLAPRHLTARSVLAGIPLGMLMPLLQAALAPHPDPVALQGQAARLLESPGARVALESVAFDAGPLHVRGSARFVPRPDGEIGADIHVSASGADALLAQAQGKPALQGLLPMVFLAKGLGRAQGDSIVWDISVGGGPLTVNGTSFGQASARTR